MNDTTRTHWSTEAIHRQFGVHTVELHVINDFDAVLDHCANTYPNDTNMIPYYAHLWNSAEALGKYIVQTFPDLSNRHVIELGCGLGLPSILCAKLNATVVATDFHPDNRTYFEHNAKRNGVAHIEYRELDWGSPKVDTQFDMIIGSDLLYESQQIERLTHCINLLLKEGGTFILADPGRDHIQAATDALTHAGFTHALTLIDDIFIVTFRRGQLPA